MPLLGYHPLESPALSTKYCCKLAVDILLSLFIRIVSLSRFSTVLCRILTVFYTLSLDTFGLQLRVTELFNKLINYNCLCFCSVTCFSLRCYFVFNCSCTFAILPCKYSCFFLALACNLLNIHDYNYYLPASTVL